MVMISIIIKILFVNAKRTYFSDQSTDDENKCSFSKFQYI